MNLYDYEKVISPLVDEPKRKENFDIWIQQEDVMPFLEKEIEDDDILIYASLPHVFIHTVLIPDIILDDSSIKDLLKWNINHNSVWGVTCSLDDLWVEHPLANNDSKILSKSEQIVFKRSFEGYKSKELYFELEQKISHILGIHFVSERNAWCRFDKFGDIEDIVKIIEIKGLSESSADIIITANKELLGLYTSVSKLRLVRMFDFTRYKSGDFSGWGDGNEPIEFEGKNNIFGNLTVFNGYGSYSRGVQIKNINVPKEQIIKSMRGKPVSEIKKKYETFIAHDWKNDTIAEISCDPSYLASYFTASNLPYEITPVFFRPEVLAKYKTDREKYQLEDRSVSCRGVWHLETFDINVAGQVHTYLIYLSQLPYEEQLHWKSYNERPKALISDRAIATDFEGRFYQKYDPLFSLKQKLEKLHHTKVPWWILRNIDAPQKVQYPYTSSRDEWAEEILNLDQLVIEGFEKKWLEKKAKELGRNPPILRELKLIEECLIGVGFKDEDARKVMSPFHDIHNLRSKLKGHALGTDAELARKQALEDFGSFRKHFEHLCTKCDDSLEKIIDAFKGF